MKVLSRSLLFFAWVLACGLGCGGKKTPHDPPPVEHDPPEIIEAYQSAATVSVGGTVTFRLSAQDAPDADLRFVWQADSGTLGTPTEQDSSSEIVWTAPGCVFADTPINIEASVTNTWGLVARRTLTVTVLRGCVGWSMTGSMSVSRAQHTASMLPSGKVLVAGGRNYSSGSVASAELYDPETGSWTPTGSMVMPRESHTASVLPSGKVLVIGGAYGATRLASAELYDPETGSWQPTGSMAVARQGHTASVLPSGKVLVVGGDNGSGYLASAELYDPETGSWTHAVDISVRRRYHTASVLPSGKVLVAGGESSSKVGISDAISEEYDPETGFWAPDVPMSTPHEEHTASVLPSGKVLIAGGNGLEGGGRADVYDPETHSWSSVGDLSGRRRYLSASVLPSGKVLVAGGTANAQALASAELYDPATRAWTVVGMMNEGRYLHTATVLPTGKVLFVGGYNSTSPLASAELCDVSKLP